LLQKFYSNCTQGAHFCITGVQRKFRFNHAVCTDAKTTALTDWSMWYKYGVFLKAGFIGRCGASEFSFQQLDDANRLTWFTGSCHALLIALIWALSFTLQYTRWSKRWHFWLVIGRFPCCISSGTPNTLIEIILIFLSRSRQMSRYKAKTRPFSFCPVHCKPQEKNYVLLQWTIKFNYMKYYYNIN
jgi:hypothetical protein